MNTTPNDDPYALYEKKEPILFYPDDPPELYLIVSKLIERKYYVKRPSKHHVKHRAVNYYPSTGTITIDGKGRHAEKGADAFLALVESEYPKHPQRGDRNWASRAKATSPMPVIEINLDDDDSSYPTTVVAACNDANELPW